MFTIIIMQELSGLLIGIASLSMTVLNCRFAKTEKPRDTKRLNVNLQDSRSKEMCLEQGGGEM